MKKLPLIIVSVLTCAALFTACKKDNGQDLSKLTLEAAVTGFDADGFTVTYTPGELCESIEYAVVASVDAKEAYAEFADGVLSVSETMARPSEPVVFPQDSIGPFTLFSRPVSSDGTKGDIVVTYATASPAGVLMSGYDDILIDLQVAISDTEKYDKVGTLVISKQVMGELGMTVEELVNMYYEADMIPVFSNGEEFKSALNGMPDEIYYVALAAVGKDGAVADVFYYTLVSPPTDPELPLPGAMTIDVRDIAETTARLIYTMGENTRCYYQAAITVDGYNELIESAPDSYEKPEDYVREYIAFYSTLMYTDDDWVWPDFIPGTEYIALAYPMNANGILGYGPTASFNFTMEGTPPSQVYGDSGTGLILPVVKESRTGRPVTSAAQVKALM